MTTRNNNVENHEKMQWVRPRSQTRKTYLTLNKEITSVKLVTQCSKFVKTVKTNNIFKTQLNIYFQKNKFLIKKLNKQRKQILQQEMNKI